jgi:hypothetical protein
VALNYLFLVLLEYLYPREDIDIAPGLCVSNTLFLPQSIDFDLERYQRVCHTIDDDPNQSE